MAWKEKFRWWPEVLLCISLIWPAYVVWPLCAKDSYSETGRRSIDPELLLRILLIGHLYGITSERKRVEELRMHLAWRWFTAKLMCLSMSRSR
jgi:hypothetical protein